MPSTTRSIHNAETRMHYIDALRGFSILLVVCHHIFSKAGPIMAEPGALALREFLASFRMPLFFFISGYVTYRASDKWTRQKIAGILGKKIKAQLIGTALFATTFAWCFNKDIILYHTHIGQGQYWFTITLFQMFLLYLLITLLSTKLPSHLNRLLLPAVSIACICIFIKFCTLPMQQLPQFPNLAWGKLCLYFPYFALGLYARKNNTLFQKALTSKKCTLVIISGFIITSLTVTPNLPNTLPGYAICYISGCFGVLAVTALFFKMRNYFTTDTPLARALTFTGKRSLDIYFIHYFFLPDIAFIPLWFYGTNPILPLLLTVIPVAIMVICISLSVSGLIRTSPILAEWLFAAKTTAIRNEAVSPTPLPVQLDNRKATMPGKHISHPTLQKNKTRTLQ